MGHDITDDGKGENLEDPGDGTPGEPERGNPDSAERGPPGDRSWIFEEIRRRVEKGESFRIEDYTDRFPDLSRFLEEYHDELKRGGSALRSSLALGSYFVGSPHPREGDTVGRYKLIEEIGRGGFGIVFLARQERPYRREVALKLLVLNPENATLRRYFQKEWQVLAELKHTGIAQILDAGFTEDRRFPYFAMEYVDGSNPLDTFCDSNRLDIDERLEIFIDVCRAVHFAHGEGRRFLHRDLKPENILVKEEPVETAARAGRAEALTARRRIPKVIDFGLAWAMEASSAVDAHGRLQSIAGGTYGYMSPEQAAQLARLEERITDDPGGASAEGTNSTEADQDASTVTAVAPGARTDVSTELDARTDVYSLGAVLYKILTGSSPFPPGQFQGKSHKENAEFLQSAVPERPSQRVRSGPRPEVTLGRTRTHVRRLHGDLDAMALRALAPDRMNRYASVSDLLVDIQRHRQHLPVAAKHAGPIERALKSIRRHPIYSIVASLVIVFIAVWLVTSEIARHRTLVAHMDEAREHKESYDRLRGQAEELYAKYIKKYDFQDTHLPPWEKEEYISKRHEWRDLYSQMGLEFQYSLVAAEQARDMTSPGSITGTEIRRFLRRFYSEYHDQLRQPEGVTYALEIFSQLAEVYRPPSERDPETLHRVTFRILNRALASAKATLHCFRYQEIGGRQAPLPFRAGGQGPDGEGFVGTTSLVVARVEERSVFSPRDRLLKVAGKPVFTRGDLVRALSGAGLDERVDVVVRRSGETRELSWLPFQPGRYPYAGYTPVPGKPIRVINIRDQFGLTFEGYPLDFRESNRVVLGTDDDVEIQSLPAGSYLFVFRDPACVETRIPVKLPTDGTTEFDVRLVRREDLPDDFVYVPAGESVFGGDLEAEQPLRYERRRLPGFAISRHEVRLVDYRSFLNDPAVLAQLDLDPESKDFGTAPPMSPRIQQALRHYPGARIRLVPLCDGYCDDTGEAEYAFTVVERDGAKTLEYTDADRMLDDLPAFGVSNLAAWEYAHWLTLKHTSKWEFRLPTDHEWEKAARGVDGRIYPWGFYQMWSFCRSAKGHYSGDWDVVGISPMDESVYGVLDLCGSVHEHTSDTTVESDAITFYSYRGGSFYEHDDSYFRICSRNGMAPDFANPWNGFRLVVSLPD